jgi:YHS domain-containing protein
MDRRAFLTTLVAGGAGLIAAPVLLRAPALAAKPEIFTGLKPGVAVAGYDPVAYFTENMPVRGDPSIVLNHGGALWFFASTANRDAFKANPDKYAPQYGGYCAWAVSQGYTAKGEPEVWKIVDGKLYLNFSKGVQKTWEKDIPGNIKSANANWPSVLN